VRTIQLEHLSSVLSGLTYQPRVFTSGNASVPFRLLSALDALLPTYRLHLLNAPRGIPHRDDVVPETTFLGPGMRGHPRLAYFPSRLSHVPLLYGRRLAIDVVLAHTSLPVDGKVSLGAEVNVVPAAIEACKAGGGVVIAQMNRQMPYTFGDGEYDVDVFDALIEVDEPLLGRVHDEIPPTAPGVTDRADSARAIGSLISDRVADGATLQLGIGEIPDAALTGLLTKRRLGVWSEMIADGVLDLDAAGALDPDRRLISSFVFGTPELYAWVNRNDRVRILRTETTNAPEQISQNPGMVSINTALQVDLFDQANASRINARIHSGFGGQTDFTVGAMHARGGQALMALRSWHPKADVSTIVPLLDEPVTSFMHTAVITEHGVAEITGNDERAQARSIIERAAHPRVRDELWEEARELGLA
jgi:acyl-CoA hydrolase